MHDPKSDVKQDSPYVVGLMVVRPAEEPKIDSRLLALIRERGWRELNQIQVDAFPLIQSGHNVLIMAPTGMGKTEAALLPILSVMLKEGAEPVSLLYITPMKALINDLYLRIKWWADKLGFRVARKHGDVTVGERARRVRRAPHILITTPESLEIDLDWAPRFRKYYENLKWVIIDEVHEFVASKRGAQLAIQLERLARIAGRDIQRIGLSATIGDPEYALLFLSGSSRRPRSLVKSELVKKPILSVRYVKDDDSLWDHLADTIMEEIEKPSLIFVNSRYMAEKLKQVLEEKGATDVFVHHSSVAPEIRREAEERLRKGEISAIVCTKTLEVGIDIGEINKVIQIKSPGLVASLIQRVGRSGHRLGLPPRGTIIALGDFDFLESVTLASLAYEGYAEPLRFSRIPLDVIARSIQGILLEKKEASIDEVYKIISAHPLSDIDRDTFENLIEYLAEQGILRINKGRIRLGSTFYKIWKFKNSRQARAWWSRDFTEFFSLISDRDVFTVRHGERIVGSIDSAYVYKYLRAGDVIRLSGRTWRVKRIDTGSAKVEVEPSEEPGDIPLWRGEGARRAKRLALRLFEVLSGTYDVAHSRVVTDSEGYKIVEKWKEEYENVLSGDAHKILLYEKRGDEHIIIAPLGSKASETIALILLGYLIKEQGMNTYYRSSFIGFSILNNTGEDLIHILSKLTAREIEQLLLSALDKSPLLHQTFRELQLSFGRLGKVRDYEEDSILYEEALRQVYEQYLDLEAARHFIDLLKTGKITVVRKSDGLSPLAREILKTPAIRPWIPDLIDRIARALDGYALTSIDLADILEVSDKTIESKLKELRKPEYGDKRVICFIDVNEESCRWLLATQIDEIASLDDFADSFSPANPSEPMRVTLKAGQSGGSREVIVTADLLLRRWEELEKNLPEEIYMVKVRPAYGYEVKELTVTYYNVPKSCLKHILLNAITVIQRRRSYY